jgi:hypothetical protein
MLSLSSLSSLSSSSVLPLIYTDNELQLFLNYIKANFSDVNGHEFEIRFSKTGKNTIPEIIYGKLLQKCIKKYKLKQEDLKYNSSIVKFYKMTKSGHVTEYRKIESKDEQICQIKNAKDKRDRCYSLGNSGDSYTIRYSSSIEQTMDCPEKEAITEKSDVKIVKVLERRRNRFEYNTGKGYIYMFTKIKDGTKLKDGTEEIKYEFEIEYDIKQLSSDLIQESLWLITDYLQTNLTIDTVDSLLKGPFLQFDKEARFIMPPKPENIKLESYQKLKRSSYTVTNKLDGERFLLFFFNGCVYARQGEKVVYITNCPKEFDNTLIDTEFFKGQFYFFDCYKFQNKSLQRELLDQRLKLAEEAANTNPALFVMKKFYKNLYKDTETLLETLPKEDNDGLIYTPQQISQDYPVYKWKFPEKMSIDFRVIKVGQVDTKYKYYLCVYTPKDQKGETHFETEYGSANYISDVELENGKIYEFMYDKSAKKFVLHRPRLDKDRPNFVNVAKDVFTDMVRPFESYKLLELFTPMFKFRKYHNAIKRDIINGFCKDRNILDLGIGRGGDIDKYKKADSRKVFGVEPNPVNYEQLLQRFPEYANTPKYCIVHPDVLATHFCKTCPVNQYLCRQCDKDAHEYAKTREHVREEINQDTDTTMVELIKTEAQNTKQIVEKVGIQGVDVVSSFFSLSFFFFPTKPDDLKKLVQTISQNLNEGGYFIGTTIDGDKTKALLNSLPNKTFNFGDGSIKLNADDTVLFEIKDTIVETQLESLVNFERLKNELETVGITFSNQELEKYSTFFSWNKDLTQEENTLNSLYRKFAFRKYDSERTIYKICNTKNISDLLTRAKDNKCANIFYNLFEKKVDMFNVPPEHVYEAIMEFILTKEYINPIDSPHLIKTVSITGDRLNKVVFRQKIPSTAVKLSGYTTVENKQNYPILREQIIKTLEALKKVNIDYGSLTPEGLLVNEEKDGNIQILFYDYSHTKKYGKTDQDNLPALLEFLTVYE